MAIEVYLITNDSSGVVENIVEWDGDTTKWQPPTGTTARKRSATGYKTWLGDNQVHGWDSVWNGSEFVFTDSRTTDEAWKDVRMHRDQLLIDTDWSAAPDRTQTDAEKKYRQDLRDLPANTSDPKNPTFPTPPS